MKPQNKAIETFPVIAPEEREEINECRKKIITFIDKNLPDISSAETLSLYKETRARLARAIVRDGGVL